MSGDSEEISHSSNWVHVSPGLVLGDGRRAISKK